MALTAVSSTNSESSNWSQVNNMIRDINAKEKVQVFKDDTGTRRVLLGKGADGFYGLKVSKEGEDVYTAANDQLVFNSDNNVFKIVKTDTVTLPLDYSDGSTTWTIPHNLGFVPTYEVYLLYGSTRYQLPFINSFVVGTPPSADVVPSVIVNASADSTNLYITWNEGGSTGVVEQTFRYYLRQETAA